MNKFDNELKRHIAVTMMRVMMLFPVFAGWSGFLYPEFSFHRGTLRSYTAEGVERRGISGKEFYEELLEAEPKQIRVKSRLLEFLFSIGDETE